jgi:hypothetical protein
VFLRFQQPSGVVGLSSPKRRIKLQYVDIVLLLYLSLMLVSLLKLSIKQFKIEGVERGDLQLDVRGQVKLLTPFPLRAQYHR